MTVTEPNATSTEGLGATGNPDAFTARHIGTNSDDQARMLDHLGYGSVDELVAAAVPESIQAVQNGDTALPPAATEAETLAELRRIAAENTVSTTMIGLGYYGTITPSVIRRNVLENPSWYTAYTPYQPEISQGRLEALLNFQTMVADLTGLTTANASMLDEATAVAEGMLMARRAAKRRPAVFIVDSDAFPQTKQVLATRAASVGIELVEKDLSVETNLPDAFGVFVQYPGSSGRIWDPSGVIEAAHEQGALVIAATDLLALMLLDSPGKLGVDIAVGNSQRFGVPLGYGGPHAGFMAVRDGLERQLPGRLVGVSRDADDAVAYRLTLQTREQHIRREKATSNICTAQVLLAVMAAMYAVYHGPERLTALARRVHARTRQLAEAVTGAGAQLVNDTYFDTLTLRVGDAAAVVEHARAHGVLLNLVDASTLSLAVDEVTADDETIVELLTSAVAAGASDAATGSSTTGSGLPTSLERTTDALTHPIFSTHHSETSMMRYLKRLADKDYALDRGMIPLGSCTMKLNAATEMEAVTWPEFAGIHPFAPDEDAAGYHRLIGDLETWLAEVTGYDAVSLQPNAGSQGELTGLLAIARYHQSRGDEQRTVCLIPSSAHGTNAASAVLVGMKVVVVACDEAGNVDVGDLKAKIDAHRDELAALMVTYPSTHGVYETQIREICDAVHEAGGQVYIDGANLNALLGYARFGQFGGDVSHLNLHKTFCIPHGGGGPGVGPVAAKAHLAEFLPAMVSTQQHSTGESARPRVSAAPFGSPGILPITWAYMRLMGAAGLKQATAAAVLAANYVASRLQDHYPVLYTGESGLVAHECILDLRELTARTGITIDDVVKRLIDFGFHAPTMSFPVPGTLMVEPTESEDLAEIERFIEAMIAIKAEADAVAAGTWPADDNPLVNAPHTAESVVADTWEHPYSRELAAYPAEIVRAAKYWPPVRRVDQAWGDRNLFCACPPIEDFA